MIDFVSMIFFKMMAVIVFYLFLPLAALTYYFSRRPRRLAETERILSKLKIDPAYRRVYEPETLSYYLWAIAYASVVSGVGLMLLFLGTEIGFPQGEFPAVELGNVEFPQKGSRLVCGMAFLGAYLWGFQHVFRRYSLNDLIPSVFYNLSMRMILSSTIAVVIYNAYSALAGRGDSDGGITANLWPGLGFLIGMFPQRGLRFLTGRIPFFSGKPDPSVRETPLEMIEGIEPHDILILEELGIDSCYDLSNADFVPLVLRTPYSARQLIDWILQAKLCVYFGEAVKSLRDHSIRTLIDLEPLTREELETLAMETASTISALERAQESVKNSAEIKRLREVGQLLGIFWKREEESPQPPETNVSSREKI